MNYKVIIRSEGRGWTDEKITEGKVSQVKNGVRLAYSLDGDGCELIANAKRVVQKRSGDQCVAIGEGCIFSYYGSPYIADYAFGDGYDNDQCLSGV